MKFNTVVIMAIFVIVSGCAGMAQIGTLNKAYSNYEDENYEEVIQLTSQAENWKKPTRELRAEIIYLKALTLEKLGRDKESQSLFDFLSQEYKDTQYGYLAIKKVK